MISVSFFQDRLDRIKYKPGYAFNITRVSPDNSVYLDMYMLDITAHVLDAANPTEKIRLNFSAAFDPQDINLPFEEFVLNQIKIMEMHEVNEWFKIDGFHLNEPHPELKDTE